MRHDMALARRPAPEDYEGLEPLAALERALRRDFPGRVALVSSFGAESVVLLHMLAQVDRHAPVLFGQTGMLFAQTLDYQRDVAATLGLTDVRHLAPDPADLAAHDREGGLHRRDADRCCQLRKVAPLERALAGFEAWITGRKRAQSASRRALAAMERDAHGRVKLNPLAAWRIEDVRGYMAQHGLPPHPLVERGYPSIGCAPCTTRVGPGEDARAGRWRGLAKEECGIHIVDGRVARVPAGTAPMDRL